jgi:hypothetical protein
MYPLLWLDNTFKGSLTRDFRLQVFCMNQCPPGPQVFYRGRFEKKINGDIRESITGDKLFSGVNDTSEKFIAGVVDTGN